MGNMNRHILIVTIDSLRADNSVAVITADHGEHLNDHDVERGHGTLWPSNLWVPLLVRSRGLIEPGVVVPELTRQIDVLPTILDYCELPMPHDMEGMSLRGLIEGTDRELGLFHCGRPSTVTLIPSRCEIPNMLSILVMTRISCMPLTSALILAKTMTYGIAIHRPGIL